MSSLTVRLCWRLPEEEEKLRRWAEQLSPLSLKLSLWKHKTTCNTTLHTHVYTCAHSLSHSQGTWKETTGALLSPPSPQEATNCLSQMEFRIRLNDLISTHLSVSVFEIIIFGCELSIWTPFFVFVFFLEERVHGKSADSVVYGLSSRARMLILKIHGHAFFIFRFSWTSPTYWQICTIPCVFT